MSKNELKLISALKLPNTGNFGSKFDIISVRGECFTLVWVVIMLWIHKVLWAKFEQK